MTKRKKKWTWVVEYYENYNSLKRVWFQATDRADALRQLHKSGVHVLEVYSAYQIRR